MAKVLEWPGTRRAKPEPVAPTRAGAVSAGPLHVLRLWMERAAIRRELRSMSDEMLRDCGLDPTAARLEADRPFFAPLHLEHARLRT